VRHELTDVYSKMCAVKNQVKVTKEENSDNRVKRWEWASGTGAAWPSGTPDGLDADGVAFLPEGFVELRGLFLGTLGRGDVRPVPPSVDSALASLARLVLSLRHPQYDRPHARKTLAIQRQFQTPRGLSQAFHSLIPFVVGDSRCVEKVNRTIMKTTCTKPQNRFQIRATNSLLAFEARLPYPKKANVRPYQV